MVEQRPDSSGSERRRAWARPADVDVGTGVARQLELMDELVAGQISGPDFARSWLASRRRVLGEGERVREGFDRILTDVFYLLDDYKIDPQLRGPSDITDAELVERVKGAIDRLGRL